ncbi:uncharacterized protein LOC128278550 [Anopheles cruzii]|uniref:uncharacterized protein LOC128278550 n=1 Tax=Anopheles cruzii TaxID=68878 RepID=UPI0022EC3A2B|nr:uncharacterized protein LOC128278550 [Anopheles cruzii]
MVLTVCGQCLTEVKVKAERSVEAVEAWMSGVGLGVARHKTEIMLVSGLRAVQEISIEIDDLVIRSQEAIRYLGVMIDRRLCFKTHVEYVTSSALRALNALSAIMRGAGGLSGSRRRLLASVATSILRYAGPAWAEGLSPGRKMELNRVHRLVGIRVAGAFRTISLAAVSVITGMTPVGILIEEDRERYVGRGVVGARTEAKRS